jgi:hypothetical protein
MPAGDDKKTPNDTGGAPGEVSQVALADLRKWRAVAVKCVKAKKPIRDFNSEAIPLELYARVERFLELAGDDVGKVVVAFDLAVAEHQAVVKNAENRKLTRAELRTANAIRKLAARNFKRQGAAIFEHLRKGLDA